MRRSRHLATARFYASGSCTASRDFWFQHRGVWDSDRRDASGDTAYAACLIRANAGAGVTQHAIVIIISFPYARDYCRGTMQEDYLSHSPRHLGFRDCWQYAAVLTVGLATPHLHNFALIHPSKIRFPEIQFISMCCPFVFCLGCHFF